MVIGVLTSSYPRHAGDAAGSFVGADVARLVRRGFRVEVLAAGDGPAGVSRTTEGDVSVTRISSGVPPPASLFYGDGAPEVLERRSPRAWIEAAHFTAALLREVGAAAPRWRAIVSHWLVPCALAGAMAAPRLPHRGLAHSGDVALLERLPFGRALARYLADSGAELVFVSGDLQRRFAALVGRPVGRVERVRPDADRFRAITAAERASARHHLRLSRPTVVAVGRLVPIKGFDLLLDAVGDLAEVVIIGDGPEEQALRTRARRRCVALRMPGALAHAEIPAWLAASDVYVQPSRVMPSGRTEGLPLATLEALAIGVPVVASRSGGLGELDASDGRISFFEPGDAASLRRALVAALRETTTNRT